MKFIELFTDIDVDELVDKVYKECQNKACETCPRKNEIEKDLCKTELITELWRKWRNVKYEQEQRKEKENQG